MPRALDMIAGACMCSERVTCERKAGRERRDTLNWSAGAVRYGSGDGRVVCLRRACTACRRVLATRRCTERELDIAPAIAIGEQELGETT